MPHSFSRLSVKSATFPPGPGLVFPMPITGAADMRFLSFSVRCCTQLQIATADGRCSNVCGLCRELACVCLPQLKPVSGSRKIRLERALHKPWQSLKKHPLYAYVIVKIFDFGKRN